ncbi:DUF1799 domain-containing protein [Alteromonas sp. RKMC-009]|uniref:DUF1799 domain-containing protein n=1 Tax=Alteromonas sp. RKMC-009 TaxID=2267264 RepID=UPI000E69062F|nr:DUF1799 domain-containing protein [Alteromonas sp. RKMC-009]AYA63828.1 hypothetical protein DS731_07340 [Alteromonas sp. RKMC-009]
MTEAQIKEHLQQDDDFQDRTLELLPENQAAFYWFLDVDDLWIFSEGIRVALDIRAVLADAEAIERRYTKQDYVKLRQLSRHVVATLAERYREQK